MPYSVQFVSVGGRDIKQAPAYLAESLAEAQRVALSFVQVAGAVAWIVEADTGRVVSLWASTEGVQGSVVRS